MPTNHSCTFCGQHENFKIHQVGEMMFGTGESFHYAECTHCGSLSICDVPKNLSPYYPKDYYSFLPLVRSSFGKNLLKNLRYGLYRLTGKKTLRPVFGEWIANTHISKSSKVADIGCGNGQLLYEMYAAGFNHLRGFDPFVEEELELGERLQLKKKTVFEIEGKFDLLMIHHALEHMAEPQKVLQQCYELLNPKGQLLVRVPVADAKVWKDEGVAWVQLDAPRHLHVPSAQGLTKMAEEVGFKCNEVIFDSTGFQFWGTELVKMGKPLSQVQAAKVFSRQDLARWRKKAHLYNQKSVGDQACFYFCKS